MKGWPLPEGPARRATDLYLTVGFVGGVCFMWLITARRFMAGEILTGFIYMIPTIMVMYSAIGMCTCVRRTWRKPHRSPLKSESLPGLGTNDAVYDQPDT